jgi:hypothetical protein
MTTLSLGVFAVRELNHTTTRNTTLKPKKKSNNFTTCGNNAPHSPQNRFLQAPDKQTPNNVMTKYNKVQTYPPYFVMTKYCKAHLTKNVRRD